jgi:class 3 adenylate cyclase
MDHGVKIHSLITATYWARIPAYSFAALILASKMMIEDMSVYYVLFIALLLLFPHICYLFTGALGNSAQGARYAMLADSTVVGLAIVAANFAMPVLAAFLGALVMSLLMISKPPFLIFNAIVVLVAASSSFLLIPTDVLLKGWPAANLLSSVFVVGYGGWVASLVFNEASGLELKRRATDKERSLLQDIFDQIRPYVSSQLIASLQRTGTVPTSRKQVTIFFSDIEGFTRLMDTLPETMIARLLNEYLNNMAEVAIEHGGTIDKFMGDGVMVIFGAPKSVNPREDAIACVRMADAMRNRLKFLRKKWSSEGIAAGLHIRMGIHSGYCAVGNFGSRQRMDYTAVGGVVNLASRLEKAAPRDQILVSSKTFQLVKCEARGESLTPIHVKGIGAAISVVMIKEVSDRRLVTHRPGFRLLSANPNPQV